MRVYIVSSEIEPSVMRLTAEDVYHAKEQYLDATGKLKGILLEDVYNVVENSPWLSAEIQPVEFSNAERQVLGNLGHNYPIGLSGGGFIDKIINAIFVADLDNMRKLHKGFPGHVDAVRGYQAGVNIDGTPNDLVDRLTEARKEAFGESILSEL